jgi:hypothetical protein
LPPQQPAQPPLQPSALQQPQQNVCDWAQAIPCKFPSLPLLNCQADGCIHLVHHICQGEWERRNSHPDIVARYCCLHHPNYKYQNAPARNNRSQLCSSSFPPNEVLPTASPADSYITGAAPVINRRKRKQSKAGSKNVGRKRKQGTATEDTRQQNHPPQLTQLIGGNR